MYVCVCLRMFVNCCVCVYACMYDCVFRVVELVCAGLNVYI